MADRALILSGDHYNITDKDTGVNNDLYQVWYCNDYRQDSPTEMGCKPIKILVTPEVFQQLREHELPALFDLDVRSRPGKQNAAALTVVGFTFVSDPNIFPVAPAPVSKPLAKAA